MQNLKMSLQRAVRWAQVTAVAIVTVLLLLTIAFLFVEQSWVEPQFRGPKTLFSTGPSAPSWPLYRY